MTDTCTQVAIDLTALPVSICQHTGEVICNDDRPLSCADCGQPLPTEQAILYCTAVIASEHFENGTPASQEDLNALAADLAVYLSIPPSTSGDDTMAYARAFFSPMPTPAPQPSAPAKKTAPPVKKSKFYLARNLVVYPNLGEFATKSRAAATMYYVAKRLPSGERQMERKPEYKDFRLVGGAMILKARRPYTFDMRDEIPPRYTDCQHTGEVIIKDDRPLYCADCGQALYGEAAARFCAGVLASENDMTYEQKQKLTGAIEGYLYSNPGSTGDDTMAASRSLWAKLPR